MPVLATTKLRIDIPTSCGVLMFKKKAQILLCHVTGTNHWDIPKGMRESEESTLHAAQRELREETGLEVDSAQFEDLGGFHYQKHKRLHLYRMQSPENLDSLDHLVCTSYFSQHVTGELTPGVGQFSLGILR